jgi:hypothetical protein
MFEQSCIDFERTITVFHFNQSSSAPTAAFLIFRKPTNSYDIEAG